MYTPPSETERILREIAERQMRRTDPLACANNYRRRCAELRELDRRADEARATAGAA